MGKAIFHTNTKIILIEKTKGVRMDNQRGTTFGFTMNMLIVLGFLIPFLLIIVTDFMQIGNIKQAVDNEFKRAVSEAIIVYVNDRHSTDRKAEMSASEQSDMKDLIENTVRDNLKDKYNIDITFKNLQVSITDKIYVTYKGYIMYNPAIVKVAKMNVSFQINVKGRSKAQRFDIE